MSKKLLKTEITRFDIDNPFNDRITKVTVSVREFMYEDGKNYYYIDYSYNPKEQNILDKDSEDGVILFKNTMVTNMIDYLLMEDSELTKHTGLTTVSDYRKLIMQSLSLFWD